jgi:hypothetical protein
MDLPCCLCLSDRLPDCLTVLLLPPDPDPPEAVYPGQQGLSVPQQRHQPAGGVTTT